MGYFGMGSVRDKGKKVGTSRVPTENRGRERMGLRGGSASQGGQGLRAQSPQPRPECTVKENARNVFRKIRQGEGGWGQDWIQLLWLPRADMLPGFR